MEFNIGDKVRVKPFDKIPEGIRVRGFSKSARRVGEIVDIIVSTAQNRTVYKILFDGDAHVSRTDFPTEALVSAEGKEAVEYQYEIEHLENVVVARLYEVTETSKVEVAKGHGHIFHDGAFGVAQAASYALKRLAAKLNDGYIDMRCKEGDR